MKVFISWSGTRSEAVAKALRDWIPNVIQAVKPWMSETDLEKGTRWSLDIAKELEQARFGVICLTPENLREPWILFEAGALSRVVEKSFVCPYLFCLQPSDIEGPLVQFQAAKADEGETKKLMQTINRALGDGRLEESQLNIAFDKMWPDLEKVLQGVPDPDEKPAAPRDQGAMIEEILELVRGQARERSSAATADLILNTLLGGEEQERKNPFAAALNPYRRLIGPLPRNLRTERVDEPETPPTDVSGGPKST